MGILSKDCWQVWRWELHAPILLRFKNHLQIAYFEEVCFRSHTPSKLQEIGYFGHFQSR